VSEAAGAQAARAITRPARAKLNLTLRIVGKRADGYHLLDSLVAFAACGDQVTARGDSDGGFAVTGPFASALADEPDNLVLRAKRALAAAAGIPTSRVATTALALDKRLPVASGIGGGSADAAATIAALLALWQVELAADRLQTLALSLGADIPVCLAGRPSRMTGIGEQLTEMPPLPPAALLLVNPLVPCPTGAVFKARQGAFSPPFELAAAPRDIGELAALVTHGGNDLEAPAARLCPPVAAILAALRTAPACRAAAMSGSGATCFGLYEDDATAEEEAARIARDQPGWWVMPTRLAS
jgi:4-diphosphocytidyl-2-C-methyl-D-erythritol kinase